jgi:hypothetical protein
LDEVKEDFEDALNEYFSYNVSFEYHKVNLENFDRYTSRGDYDDYFEAFKDNNDVEYDILKDRRKKQLRLKGQIKNRVELIYR